MKDSFTRAFPIREVQGARCSKPQSGLAKQGNAEILHREGLGNEYLRTTPSLNPGKVIIFIVGKESG